MKVTVDATTLAFEADSNTFAMTPLMASMFSWVFLSPAFRLDFPVFLLGKNLMAEEP
jgi:hypothetical protein